MFLRRFLPLVFAASMISRPTFAAPPSPQLASWNFQLAEDPLEGRWSWRAPLQASGPFEARVAVNFQNAKNFDFLRVWGHEKAAQIGVFRVQNGVVLALAPAAKLDKPVGVLVLQTLGGQLRVLWNDERILSLKLETKGRQFGTATRGAVRLQGGEVQATEPIVFRDDFMRADTPDAPENHGEWTTAGVWKTSGTLGPRSDAALNPNPFVFRAQGEKISTAKAGKWFWSDYSVSASVRAVQNDEKAPLVAGLGAYGVLSGEIDFRGQRAILKQNGRILAEKPVVATPDEWHRLRLEPGPGVARLLVDGVEVVRATANLAQGQAALTAQAGGQNWVDFDDVRIGALAAGEREWGEGALPEKFIKDRLMSHWASPVRAWKRDEKGIYWHTGDFFGPAQVSVPLPKLGVGEGLRIFIGAERDEPNKGATLDIRKEKGGALRYTMYSFRGPVPTFQTVVADAPGAMLIFAADAQREFPRMSLNGKVFNQSIGLMVNLSDTPQKIGTKIGIQPVKDGQPLPAPPLQKVALQSDTFDRDGRAAIGINITPVTPQIQTELGLPDAQGAIVDALEDGAPASRAGVKVGDVIRWVEGAKVIDTESLRAAIGGRKPGSIVRFEVLRQNNDARLDWSQVSATTSNVLDYSFTSAPVDWRPAKGRWEVAERWTCSPQWSFFAGENDANPTLWSRFATKGDWTLEAYLATPMDQARGERSPTDLNVTVGGDGRDLASGYSFLFGAKSRAVNQIRRGDEVAWEKAFELPAGIGDTHQDWFYVRLERRQTPQGLKFRYSVNGRLITEYLDPKPLPDSGQIAFWTQNGGLSIARVRLWHSGVASGRVLTGESRIASEVKNDLGVWNVRRDGRHSLATLASMPAKGGDVVIIRNAQSGGDWTVYVSKVPFDVAQRPQIAFDYKLPTNVKVNLYARIAGVWREILFTGGATPANTEERALGKIEGVVADNQWHSAKFDLRAALKKVGVQETKIESLAFAAPNLDYLRAGLGGNHWGASYEIRNFAAPEAKIQTAANVP